MYDDMKDIGIYDYDGQTNIIVDNNNLCIILSSCELENSCKYDFITHKYFVNNDNITQSLFVLSVCTDLIVMNKYIYYTIDHIKIINSQKS